MAASIMRARAPENIRVFSAGTQPGESLNALSVQTLEARGYSVEGEYPKAAEGELVEQSDLVVFLGNEAQLDLPEGVSAERWSTVEPSLNGIEGEERMNLILDDIEARVNDLVQRIS